MLKEEALELKKTFEQWWFFNHDCIQRMVGKRKISYGIREKGVNGEAGEVSGETVNAWTERLRELKKDYDLADIWNIDERAAFSKHFQWKV